MKTGLKVAAAMMVIMSGTVIAAPFSVSSADMRDGQNVGADALVWRFWLHRRQYFTADRLEKCSGGYPQFRGDRLRSGCADRERLVALDGGEYCPTGDWL
ncbi:putative outer membrane protein [Klebsiella michiganensis]|uniref:Putative outer membrane protein n=1 Tax=Klebsiella michiganensis TaxID=1134687 RepID=A0A7H4N2C2_9ENTR|nr:putative outer membrane protein [Klebsiella michiganensis]